ncbi:hypothetical protein PUN28_013506 [Cardiocondyla obscurior]|uniref:Uncharacterized protein n=1 Tax=Cardiocondyla obscurior TaxID=286306 RepID=A0AAW2F395_9HYME
MLTYVHKYLCYSAEQSLKRNKVPQLRRFLFCFILFSSFLTSQTNGLEKLEKLITRTYHNANAMRRTIPIDEVVERIYFFGRSYGCDRGYFLIYEDKKKKRINEIIHEIPQAK